MAKKQKISQDEYNLSDEVEINGHVTYKEAIRVIKESKLGLVLVPINLIKYRQKFMT